MPDSSRYRFQGHAVATEAHIRKPEDHICWIQGAMALPVTGGYGKVEVPRTEFLIPGTRSSISFDSAAAFVSGDFLDFENPDSTVRTVTAASVNGLTVLDRLHVKTLSAHLVLEDSHLGQPRIFFGRTNPLTRVEQMSPIAGLTIDGFPVEIDFNPLVTQLSTMQELEEIYQHDHGSRREYSRLFEYDGDAIRTSIVRGLRFADGRPEDTVIENNVIIVRNFARIFVGELLIEEYSRSLTLLRLQYDSNGRDNDSYCHVRPASQARPSAAAHILFQTGALGSRDRTLDASILRAFPLPGSPSAAASPKRREITVTGHALNGDPVTEFDIGPSYQLRFQVGSASDVNLAYGNLAIADIPKGGLQTNWVVTSETAEFLPALSTAQVRKIGSTWVAEFDLLIPERGASGTQTVGLLGSAYLGSLLLTIYAISGDGTREVYREVTVGLAGRPTVEVDETCRALNHTGLRKFHDWTTPPERILVTVLRGGLVRVDAKGSNFYQDWDAVDNSISGAIKGVRESLEDLRESEPRDTYFDNLEPADITERLRAWPGKLDPDRHQGWRPLPDDVDSVHADAFDKVRKSEEWRGLARDGYALFDRCFSKNSMLRALLEGLKPGSRIDFHWTLKGGGPGWVSHVPWALMYMEPVDVTGLTLPDPEKFLGLRFRIGTRSWTVNDGSVVLGGLDKTHSMNLLYWGDKQGDDVAVESKWQAAEYAKWKQSKLLPDPALPDLKKQIMLALKAPGPSPVSVLYFYCHCSVGDGGKPILRFGNTSKPEDTFARRDLSQEAIPDAPLIFANACTTSQADSHMTSELEQSFFERGVRGFIGTETKVPIQFASRFAWIYFQFLYRTVAPEPVSAGEALTQTRMFLWTQYQNIGGLFYSMTNQYDLYVASEAEVVQAVLLPANLREKQT